MKQQITSSKKNTVYGSQLIKVIFNSFHHCHSLSALILHHYIVFQRLGINFYVWHFFELKHSLILPVKYLSTNSSNLQLRIEGCKKCSYQILKPIEYRQRTYQCQRSKCHSTYGNSRNHIDSIVRFLGKQISSSYVKGEIHGVLIFHHRPHFYNKKK